MKNFDKYYDPPEEEAPICGECGQEMESVYPDTSDPHCFNEYCPAKFTGIAKEMAEEFVVAKDVIKQLEKRVKFLVGIIRIYDPDWDK